MENDQIDRIVKMVTSFQQLPEEGQSYILGISQALLFAQEHFADGQKLVDINAEGTAKRSKKVNNYLK